MRIAFDLDDTLIAEYFPAEAASFPARLLFREKLRLGTKALFEALRSKGHEIWIYTTSCRSESYIKWLFRLHSLRLDGVINQDIHSRIVKVAASKYPPAFGIDLLVDNSRGTELEGQLHGFRAIIIDQEDANWTEAVLTGVKETARSLCDLLLEENDGDTPLNRILRILARKHVILIGGDVEVREALLEKVKERLGADRPVYELPAGIGDSDEYIAAIQRIFPIKSPLGIPTAAMNYNQVSDMDLDWTWEDVPNALIVWHHFDKWRQEEMEWLYQFLDSYVSYKYFAEEHEYCYTARLIASGVIDPEDFYRKATVFFNTGDKSPADVVREHLEFISLSEIEAEI